EYIDHWSLAVERGEWRLSAVHTLLASGVSTATAAELRQAVLEYDHLEEKAYAANDADVVRPRATANIAAQLKRTFDRNPSAADQEIEKLEGITFRGFRQPSEGRADVDA